MLLENRIFINSESFNNFTGVTGSLIANKTLSPSKFSLVFDYHVTDINEYIFPKKVIYCTQ